MPTEPSANGSCMTWSTELADEAIRRDDAEHASKRRLLLVGLGCVLAFQIVAMVIVAWVALHISEPDVWDPLGEYPIQRADAVITVVDGVQPIARTVGVKCADETVDVLGSMAWQSLNPRGSNVVVIAPGAGAKATREQGCAEQAFANPVPDEVVRLTRTVGGGVMTWQLAGLETPFDGARQGTPRAWATTPIVIRTGS